MLELRVSDLKQYLFCPRVVYYQMFLPVRPLTRKMQFGGRYHLREQELEQRRGFRKYGLQHGHKEYHRSVRSQTLGLSGVLDLVIQMDNRVYPVEYKHTFREAMLNAKVQLTAYAMMLEETAAPKKVEVGFVYSIPINRVYEVRFDSQLRKLVKEVIEKVRHIASSEMRPKVKSRPWCSECEYRLYCRDIV